jgi:hypothetical protein
MSRIKTGRKRICGGAEVISLGEVSERMKDTVNKNVKEGNRQKNETTKTKEDNQEKRKW